MHTRVEPDGRLDAKLAFIGEAPGGTEEVTGLGFTGASGKLLWAIAGAFGLTRADVYVTNVIKVRPPADNLDSMIRFDRGRAIHGADYVMFEQELRDELDKLTDCNLYVAIGNVSLFALTRKMGVTKWRGSIIPACNGKKTIPLIHPAAALRQYSYMNMIRLDMARVAEEMQFPEFRMPYRNLILEPSYITCVAYLKFLKEECTSVAFDIEVYNNELGCISFSHDGSTSICIPFVAHGNDYFSPEQERTVMLMIAAILQDPNIVKIGQNLAFDSTFMFTKYHIVVQNMEDTMIGQAIAFPDYPKGLDFITSVYTKEPYYKDDGKRYFKHGGNEKDFWSYNAKDSVVLPESWNKIKGNISILKNDHTYHEQRNLISSLTYMQWRGMKVDTIGLAKERERVNAEIEKKTEELNKLCGYPINHNSPKQLIDYFYTKKGEKPYVKRGTGTPTTDEDALKRLSRKGYSEAGTILDLRHLSKLKGTYLDVTLDSDSRLRCSFNPVGTSQGRLSSSETIFGTGTNMQNLPEEFRRFLVADEDCLMFNVDLSQAENRIVAYIAPEPAMIYAFEHGIDLHCQTASLISNLAIDEIKRQDKENILCDLGSGSYTWRFWGKKGNHSLNYDLGYKTFSLRFELPEKDGHFIVERYHKVYPGVRQYHAWVRHQLGKDRTLTNLMGRRRLFTDRWGDDLFKQAYSYTPQSTVADIINKRGLNELYYNQHLYRPVDLLLQVHDSILFQMNYKLFSYEDMAKVLISLVNKLEIPLVWGTREFIIPANVTVGLNFMKKNMIEVDTHGQTTTGLAERIRAVHEKLRAAVHV